jgi:long-subunit fatty acid transport protein
MKKLAIAWVLIAPHAIAGGFELPDIGTQGLGRGGAFTARADDGMALQYNVAGLARQRGTHLLLGANLVTHQFRFKRAGRYPSYEQAFPYNGKTYPLMVNSGGPGILPAGVITSDLGGLNRLTIAAGLLTPSAAANRTFVVQIPTTDGKSVPSPTRLDAIRNGGSIYYPTVGFAYRVTRALDLGVSLSAALWTLDSQQSAYFDAPDTMDRTCTRAEHVDCVSQTKLTGSATSFSGAIGAMIRPSPSVQLGAQFRLPTSLKAEDVTYTQTATKSLGTKPEDQKVSVEMNLPWVLRVGARAIKMVKTFELYDLEANLTVEGWGGAQGDGIRTNVPKLNNFEPYTQLTQHGYTNTVSARVGGGYNIDLGGDQLTVRGGAYYDSSATPTKYTRIDVDTLAKIGATIGLGYRVGAFSVNAAFALVGASQRTVTDGAIFPSNAARGGKPSDALDQKFPAINNGVYWSATQIFSLSVDVALDTLWEQKGATWGDSRYEVLRDPGKPDKKDESEKKGEDEEKKEEEKKEEEKKEEEKKEEEKKEEEKKDPEKSDDSKDKKKRKDPEDPFS